MALFVKYFLQLLAYMIQLVIVNLMIVMLVMKDKDHLDKGIKFSHEDLIVLSLVYMAAAIYTFMTMRGLELLVYGLIVGYLTFMTYTDIKTKQLYSMVSLVELAIGLGICTYSIVTGSIAAGSLIVNSLIYIVVLAIIGMVKGLGKGDLRVYLSLWFLQFPVLSDPLIISLVQLMLGMAAVVTCNPKTIVNEIKKKETYRKAFMPYLSFGVLGVSILGYLGVL